MLKIYIYGYLNRVPSRRRLERECERNVGLIWLMGRLAPDFKAIADFRRDKDGSVCERAMVWPKLKVLADRGYFSGLEIRACDLNDISAYVPKPLTSASRKKGLFTKADFVYVAKDEVYRCPAGERAIHRFNTVEHDMNLRVYWRSACPVAI